MMNHETTLTDANFNSEVLKSNVPVLVDFWAEWCYPCKMIAPVVKEISSEYAGKLKVGKLDTDRNQTTAVQYGISGIPTLLLFKNGQVVDRIVGALTKHALKAKIDYYLTGMAN
jgi:thioredoxin 1